MSGPLTLLFTLAVLCPAASAAEIRWSGLQWTVRSDTGSPGPNKWSGENVVLDGNGLLHLKITKTDNQWRCAELQTVQSFGYGTYQFWVIGAVNALDPNVTFGAFSYPEPSVGPDGTNEIDIEMGRSGNAAWPIGNYTAWPAAKHSHSISHSFNFSLRDMDVTERYTWRDGSIHFQTLRGHTNSNDRQIDHWTTPKSFTQLVATRPMPVHLNLWLFEGKPPTDGKPVEVIVKAFKFQP